LGAITGYSGSLLGRKVTEGGSRNNDQQLAGRKPPGQKTKTKPTKNKTRRTLDEKKNAGNRTGGEEEKKK